jgi:hypothetical protein
MIRYVILLILVIIIDLRAYSQNCNFSISTKVKDECFSGSDGRIDIEIKGGAGPFTIEWKDKNIKPYRINMSAGSYTVTITDANNCFEVRTIEIDNIERTEPKWTNNSSNFRIINARNDGKDYYWFGIDDAFNSSGQNINYEGSSNLKLLVKYPEGCVDSYIIPANQ